MGIASGPFLVLIWFVTFFLKSWHVENDQWQLIHTYIGLLGYTFSPSQLGTGVNFLSNIAASKNEKFKQAQEFLKEIQKEGSYWIWEARDMFCADDLVSQASRELVPMLKEKCTMWSNIAIGSYCVIAFFIFGLVGIVVGSFLNFKKPTLSPAMNKVRLVACGAGPGCWLLGIVIYMGLTMKAPSGDEVTFGAGFFVALAVSILGFAPLAISFFEGDKVGSARNADGGDQGVEMQPPLPPQGQHGFPGSAPQYPGGGGQGPGFALAPPPMYNQGGIPPPAGYGGYPAGMSTPFR